MEGRLGDVKRCTGWSCVCRTCVIVYIFIGLTRGTPGSTLFPSTTRFGSVVGGPCVAQGDPVARWLRGWVVRW